MLEYLCGYIQVEDYIDLIIVGGLIHHLSTDERYNEEINIQELFKSEAEILDTLEKTIIKIEEEIPTLKDVFQELTSFSELETSKIVRFFYNLNEILKEMSLEQLIESYEKQLGASHSFSTPASINALVAEILQPTGTFYDGTMHYGGGALAMLEHAKKRNESLYISGQEIVP